MSSQEQGSTEGTDVSDISRTGAYRLVSHAYRRALVECLVGREGGVALADAAADVAARNLDGGDGEPCHDERRDVYAALHHSHVPKLAAEGIVAHDRERNVVSLTERGRVLAGLAVDDPTGDDGSADSIW